MAYLATFEFISGNVSKVFITLLYAKNAKDMDKQIHKIFKRHITVLGIWRFIILYNTGMVKFRYKYCG